MTKHEHARRAQIADTLSRLGFNAGEVDTLRRISLTLRRWHELECGIDGGCIERDEKTGKPFWVSEFGARWGMTARTRRPIADRETGALRRLQKIMRDVNERRFVGDIASTLDAHCDDLTAYIQTDPRGAALYILRPGDVPEGSSADSCYSRGICVY